MKINSRDEEFDEIENTTKRLKSRVDQIKDKLSERIGTLKQLSLKTKKKKEIKRVKKAYEIYRTPSKQNNDI